MWIEFAEKIINLDYVRIIFLNSHLVNENFWIPVIEMHFHDSVKRSNNIFEDIYSLKLVYEFFSKEEKAYERYKSIKKLLLNQEFTDPNCNPEIMVI